VVIVMVDVPTYSLEEVAELVGKAPSTMRYWVKEGRLEAEMIGGKLMVRPSELRRKLAELGIERELPAPPAARPPAPGEQSFGLADGLLAPR
jgi:excisionase family DNA binding protein